MRNEIRLYNVIFPIFMLYLFSPLFWGISILGNFIIDSLILLIIILILFKRIDFKIYKKLIPFILLFGFISDLLGAGYLTLVSIFVRGSYYIGNEDLIRQIESGIYLATNHSPYQSLWGVAFIASGIFVSALFIYIFNYHISFKKIDISKKQRILSSLAFAIFTAPYTFLIPKELFY